MYSISKQVLQASGPRRASRVTEATQGVCAPARADKWLDSAIRVLVFFEGERGRLLRTVARRLARFRSYRKRPGPLQDLESRLVRIG